MSTIDDVVAYPAFFGGLGATLAMSLCGFGSALGIAMSGITIGTAGTRRPELVIRSFVPVVMASIVAVYGLILAVLISRTFNSSLLNSYSSLEGYMSLGAGLALGFSGIASGYTIGKVGYSGVLSHAQQPKIFIAFVLILIFGEVLAVYGLIISLLMIIT